MLSLSTVEGVTGNAAGAGGDGGRRGAVIDLPVSAGLPACSPYGTFQVSRDLSSGFGDAV